DRALQRGEGLEDHEHRQRHRLRAQGPVVGRVLAPDVTVWTDGGGKASGGLRPVHGRDKAARLFAGYATRRGSGFDLRYRRVNGDDSAVLFEGESPYAVMVMDLTADGEQVSGVYIVTNPEKLAHVRRDDENQETGIAEGERA
ncbi:hypothetical protein ABZ504_27260, partial [Streptomyces mirabilis]